MRFNKSLLETHPDICKFWHPTKNEDLTLKDVSFGMKKEVWWLCEKGHSYKLRISHRVNSKLGCPYCSGHRVTEENSLANDSQLMKEWHPNKNKLNPKNIMRGSRKIAWWLCEKGHSYQARIDHKYYSKTRCPYCINVKVDENNCLETKFPEIAKEWHPTKNNLLTPKDIVFGSGKKVWWLCEKGHSYQTSPSSRNLGNTGCPNCYKKTENKVRIIFINIFKVPFPTKRPKWLEGLELDGYNENLKIAFEYDGEFHFKGHFKNDNYLEKQKENDSFKNNKCVENGVKLIRIPYTEKNNLEEYILNKLKI